MEIEGTEPDLEEPGPRLARTLAEQEAKHARRRRTIGIAIIVVGVLVAAGAVWATSGSDDRAEREVGKLTASNVDGAKTGVSSATVTKADDKAGSPTTTVAGDAKATPARWPANIHGRPAPFGKLDDPPPADAGILEPGYYLWNDFDGFHLWQVGGGDGDQATVSIDDEIGKADAVGGDVEVIRTGNSFTLKRGGADEEVVGVDFSSGFYGKNIIVGVEGDLPLHIGSRAKAVASYYGIRYESR